MSLNFERIQTYGIAELSYLVGNDSEGVRATHKSGPDFSSWPECLWNGFHQYLEEVNMGTNNWEVDKTEETAAEFQGSGTSTGFENVKNIIADKLHSAAEGLGANVTDQDGDSATAKYGKQASEWLDHSAEYVRNFDYKQADAGIREYVKQSPGRSLLMAGAVGLIIGALLRRR